MGRRGFLHEGLKEIDRTHILNTKLLRGSLLTQKVHLGEVSLLGGSFGGGELIGGLTLHPSQRGRQGALVLSGIHQLVFNRIYQLYFWRLGASALRDKIGFWPHWIKETKEISLESSPRSKKVVPRSKYSRYYRSFTGPLMASNSSPSISFDSNMVSSFPKYFCPWLLICTLDLVVTYSPILGQSLPTC